MVSNETKKRASYFLEYEAGKKENRKRNAMYFYNFIIPYIFILVSNKNISRKSKKSQKNY